ncbi:nucleoside permease [Mucilaginibacter defluvii]|uniref:MFS transporter n=1 Tax=Mucilaginibacter defluvii TaxID=1196019 RepID=A0ABP9FMJ8_9SPHI
MTFTNRFKLSAMMFLEFFIWGGWFVNLGTYLIKNFKSSGSEVGAAYLTQSIGAIVAPFIIGLIADRFFSAQKILGVLHLLGGLLLWRASTSEGFTAFYPNILIYMILYMPTLALVNSVAFRQMDNPQKQFPPIRVLGTLGWIFAGFLVSWLSWDKLGSEAALVNTFKMSGTASLILGLFSFTLPATPPVKKGQQVSVGDVLGLDAIGLLKNKSYLFFFIASVAICIPLAFYYGFANVFLQDAGVKGSTITQSLGQVSETVFMICIPFFFVRLGVKKMLAIGMSAWVLRYVLFAYGNGDTNYWMLLGGIVLHGICYDFFFVTGQIYTDNLAGEKFKSSAQGFITLATYGVGMLIGSILSGKIYDSNVGSDGSIQWQSIWLVPAGIAAVVLVLFLLLFRDKKHVETQPGVDAEDAEIVL